MSYIEIEKGEAGVTLKLTPAGREELEGYIGGPGEAAGRWTKPTYDILRDLMEDWFCNGWEWINPEEIGALTSAPIISDEVERDDQGNITKLGRVYWFPDYAITDELEELLTKGEVVFPSAEED